MSAYWLVTDHGDEDTDIRDTSKRQNGLSRRRCGKPA